MATYEPVQLFSINRHANPKCKCKYVYPAEPIAELIPSNKRRKFEHDDVMPANC